MIVTYICALLLFQHFVLLALVFKSKYHDKEAPMAVKSYGEVVNDLINKAVGGDECDFNVNRHLSLIKLTPYQVQSPNTILNSHKYNKIH